MAKAKTQNLSGPAVVAQSYELVSVADLKPHPKNARKSDNAAIDQSIASNGFYGAVCVQRSTGFILVGTHRWDRARAAGIKQVPVLYLDVDDKAALKILTADNRVLDRAGYDQEALARLLNSIQSECGSLEGTGYLPEDLDEIIADVGNQILRDAKDRVSKLTPAPASNPEPPEPEPETETVWAILIRCKDESEQAALLSRLIGEGLDVAPGQAPSKSD